MTTVAGSERTMDKYLARVRAALLGLPEGEIDDILRELRSHIVELAGANGGDVEAAIRSLGDPVDLSKSYRTENLLAQAECGGSPLAILQGLRHGSRSGIGRFLGTVLYVFGYANVLTLWAAAIEKLFAPSRTGLWYEPGSWWPFTLVTDGQPPPGAREVLGWWLIPAAAVLGWALRYLIDRIALRWIRRHRRSTARPPAPGEEQR